MTQPASIAADGNLKVVWVPVIADVENPTAAELNAGLDISCYLTAEGFTPGTDEQTITDDRLCSTQTFEKPGRFSDTLEVGYIYNPASPGNNAAYTTLPKGTTGHIATRWGKDYSTPFVATDLVDIYPAQAGVQRKQPPTANSVLTVTQKLFITGPVQRDVVVA